MKSRNAGVSRRNLASVTYWPRASAAVSALITAAVLLTGSAAMWQPLLFVGADATPKDADIVAPVAYTTSSGEEVSCTYAAYLSPAAGRVDIDNALSRLKSQDWATFGHEVMQYALEHPFTETGPEWHDMNQAQREKIAFDQAAAAVVISRAGGALPADTAILATTDCSGNLSSTHP